VIETNGANAASTSNGRHAIFLCLLVAAGLFAYANNFTAEFVYDDYPFIVENPAVRTLSDPVRFFFDRASFSEKGQYVIYRPLATLSFALNYSLGGYNPTLFHTVNIALHIACGLLVYVFLFRTFSNAAFAFFAALFFLVHPVQAEAVSWIAARGNPMFLLFLLTAVMGYANWSAGGRRPSLSYALALVCAVLALTAKEMAVVLPVLLVVYDVSITRPGGARAWVRRLCAVAPFFALSLVYVLVRHSVLGETRQIGYWGGSLGTTLLTMTKALAYYVRLMFVPRPLMVEYMMPVAKSLFQSTVLVSLFFLAVLAAICVLSYRKAPVVFFGIAWFFVSLLPVSNIIPLQAIINERFLYLPSIGFCAILASPLLCRGTIAGRRTLRATVVALMVVALCYGVLTFDRNRDWRDSLSLWTASVRQSPAGSTSRYNLGLELYRRGRYDEAAEHLKVALALQDVFPSAHGTLGNVYFTQRKYADAIREFEQGLSQAPHDGRLRHNLAMAWFAEGRRRAELGANATAIRCFVKALEYEPGLADAEQAVRELSRTIAPESSSHEGETSR
jgi:hypothetical protein